MKKKPWGRLGAAISAVALLAGGLVGVAAPAQADDLPTTYGDYVYKELANVNGHSLTVTLEANPSDSYSDGTCQPAILDALKDRDLAPNNFLIYYNTPPSSCSTYDPIPVSPPPSPPVQHKDVVCAYHVTKYLGGAETAASSKCQNDLKPGFSYPDVVTEETSDQAPNGKYLITATVSTQYLEAGFGFESPDYPSGWNECPEGLFATGSGCEEHIAVGWPESQECPDGQVLTEDGCEEEIPVGEPEWQECPDGQVLTAEGCKEEILVGEPDVSGGPQAEAKEPVQMPPPPPPCWDSAINNCPVGGALRFAAPRYAMVGVPVTMYAYASWRPDANAPSQPTNGTAVIRVDGEDYAGVEFADGVAEWRFIPETEGMKEFTASGVLFSGLSGANAYIDTVPARTYVLEYDPAAYATALKKKRVEVGDTYVITDPNQARSYAEDRYEWSVSSKSDDVCAVYETKKGAVKAKFTDSGKCTVIWLNKESEESGKYTFIAKK